MAYRARPFIERLETRVLLAHLGLDLGFGDVGLAPVGGTVLVKELDGGKVLAVNSDKAARLNADGTVDPSFIDTGGAPPLERPASFAFVSGHRLTMVGRFVPTAGMDMFVRAIR